MHKRTSQTGDVYRATYETDLPTSFSWGEALSIDTFRSAISEPSSRAIWDRLVESSTTLEVLDVNTRVVHTKYKLGWPSSPRDSITIQRTYVDEDALICVATSLPRSKWEPSYLKPCPPYVRAHVNIVAWHVQFLPSHHHQLAPNQLGNKLRIACHFSWNPCGSWAIGTSLPTLLPSLLQGLREYVGGEGITVPELVWASRSRVLVDHIEWDIGRRVFKLEYSIVDGRPVIEHGESSRLSRSPESNENHKASIVVRLAKRESWDVSLVNRTGDPCDVGQMEVTLGRHDPDPENPISEPALNYIYLRIDLGLPKHPEHIKRMSCTIERTVGRAGDVRFNGGVCLVTPIRTRANDLQLEQGPFGNSSAAEESQAFPNATLSPKHLLGDSSKVLDLSEMSLRALSVSPPNVDFTETMHRTNTHQSSDAPTSSPFQTTSPKLNLGLITPPQPHLSEGWTSPSRPMFPSPLRSNSNSNGTISNSRARSVSATGSVHTTATTAMNVSGSGSREPSRMRELTKAQAQDRAKDKAVVGLIKRNYIRKRLYLPWRDLSPTSSPH